MLSDMFLGVNLTRSRLNQVAYARLSILIFSLLLFDDFIRRQGIRPLCPTAQVSQLTAFGTEGAGNIIFPLGDFFTNGAGDFHLDLTNSMKNEKRVRGSWQTVSTLIGFVEADRYRLCGFL